MILALYTYSAGLRAPALIAFVKDLMIYIVVLAAVVLVHEVAEVIVILNGLRAARTSRATADL